MDNERLNELRERQKELSEKINNAASKKNEDWVKMSEIDQKIAELEKQKHELGFQMSQDDSDHISDTVELDKIQEEISKIEAENENKKQNITIDEYNKMLDDYNKKLEAYNKKVPTLYGFQKKYEDGKIEYSEYDKFATPLAEEYVSLKDSYKNLQELYSILNNKYPFANLTDEQLNEKLNDLNDKAKQEFDNPNNTNNTNGISITQVGKLNSDITAIKNEQIKRKNIANARATSDEELSKSINTLEAALQSGAYDKDSEKLEGIKASLSLLQNEQNERKSRPLLNLTDEQLDAKLAELDEEYIEEWNYGAHDVNGMEDVDDSRLNKIKEQMDLIKTEKSKRINVISTKLEMPKEPQSAMFIAENNTLLDQIKDLENNPNYTEFIDNQTSNDIPASPDINPNNSVNGQDITDPDTHENSNPQQTSNNPYAGRLHIKEEDVERQQSEQKRIAQEKSEKYYEQAYEKWYQKAGSTVKGWLSSVKNIFSKSKPKALTAGLKDDLQNSNNSDYDDSDKKENTFFKDLQNHTHDDSSKESVITDKSGNVKIDIIPPKQSSDDIEK